MSESGENCYKLRYKVATKLTISIATAYIPDKEGFSVATCLNCDEVKLAV